MWYFVFVSLFLANSDHAGVSGYQLMGKRHGVCRYSTLISAASCNSMFYSFPGENYKEFQMCCVTGQPYQHLKTKFFGSYPDYSKTVVKRKLKKFPRLLERSDIDYDDNFHWFIMAGYGAVFAQIIILSCLGFVFMRRKNITLVVPPGLVVLGPNKKKREDFITDFTVPTLHPMSDLQEEKP